MISHLQVGSLIEISEMTNLLAVSFIIRDTVPNDTMILGEITSVRISEWLPGVVHGRTVSAFREPSSAATRILTHMRFDINRDGKLDIDDISDIIYYLYLRQEGSPAWIEWEGWKFDINGDGIIDITDLLYIVSYF